ncbi:MerR family transcriptional regulator [Sphingomonas sp. 1P06PA]|uniref:MerR family transcriptional regulator n=1 Tax=Sphingomonas sp. 1P06PA TaxID=554121 RepID=UPI0039A5BE18
MTDILDIADVVRRTGVTARALRFYEARGLIRPLRTGSGRRLYGPGELARLHEILALKRAGLKLADIGPLLARQTIDLARLVEAEMAALDERAAEIDQARALLAAIKTRLDRGEAIDSMTFCDLISQGDRLVDQDKWQAVTAKYFDAEAQAAWAATMPDGFDQQAYAEKWKTLSARIAAALPLDPTASEAQAFVDEWFALLKPFSQVATPAMWNGTVRMYDDMANWPAQPEMGFGPEVWGFIREATQARIAAGGTIDGPAWMTGGTR